MSGRPIAAGVWRLADPRISLASIAAMALATAAAARDGPLAVGWLAITVLGVLAIEVAKNASGEIYDYRAGVDQAVTAEDRSPFSGGKRVLVDGYLTVAQTWTVAALGYLVGLGAGVAIILYREPSVVWFGLAGIFCAFFYHAPPLRLSYRGLGELTVAACYGPLLVAGTYLVQRGELPFRIVLLGVPLGLLIAAFLVINEFPDYHADASGAKRNLVVRLGREGGARLFTVVVSTAFAALALLPLVGLPVTVWLGVIGAIPAATAAETALRYPADTRTLISAQARTLQSFVLLAVGTGVGLLLRI